MLRGTQVPRKGGHGTTSPVVSLTFATCSEIAIDRCKHLQAFKEPDSILAPVLAVFVDLAEKHANVRETLLTLFSIGI